MVEGAFGGKGRVGRIVVQAYAMGFRIGHIGSTVWKET